VSKTLFLSGLFFCFDSLFFFFFFFEGTEEVECFSFVNLFLKEKDQENLIDAICTATPSEIKVSRELESDWFSDLWCFKKALREAYDKENIIKFDTRVKLESAGDLQAILEANLNPSRPESGVDMSKMEDDVNMFLKRTEGQTGTDIRFLAKLIATRSREHLNALHVAVAK
jgi:hypothetical protein